MNHAPGPRRIPNVPTLKEQGIDVDMGVWFGVFARAGTPADIVKRLRTEIRHAVEQPAFQKQIKA